MEDLAVFTALNHSGSFGKNFFKFKNNKQLCSYCYQSKLVIVKINQFYGLIPKQEVDNSKFSLTRNHSCLVIMLSNLIKSTD